ncbi:MAG: universal stress protein [Leptospiraceae bacterium]|nr:universal stress protein [Leptospiraceae bacterium]MCB1315113.1 universal stress protein [Leptospiraceae bacterium]MCB1323127.1 universal stress protein [Leptospiraceae bacterium]
MEKFLKKILVPVDGSKDSAHALEAAEAMARNAKATLTVLEVVEEFGPLPGYYEAAPAGQDRTKWISDQRFEKVHPILEETSVKWDRKVVEGFPADKIVEVAEDGKYDLIVIGSRGLSALGRFLMGSVSDRVIHHAPCSVMVVRP